MPHPLVAPETSDYVLHDFIGKGYSIQRLQDEKILPLDPNVVGYSEPIPGSAEKGFSEVYRNKATKVIKKYFAPGFETYHGVMKNTIETTPDAIALSSRKFDFATKTSAPVYEGITYAELDRQRKALGSGLLFLLQNNPYKIPGFEAHDKIDSHVADYAKYDTNDLSFVVTLFAQNRAEWIITDIMCASYSITNTALYDTLGPGTSKYILELTSSPVVIASGIHIRSLLDLKRESPEDLKGLICLVSMDPLDEVFGKEGAAAIVQEGKAQNVMIYDWKQVMNVGEIFPVEDLPPNPTTTYTISFTSGTTGSRPKGVVLTHNNLTAAIAFLACQFPEITEKRDFCFLPLAHIFQRCCVANSLLVSANVAFPQLGGTPLTLVEDLKIFKPTYMANVPRVFTKFEAAIKNATVNADSSIVKNLFSRYIYGKVEKQSSAENEKGSSFIYDRFLAPKVKRALGLDNLQWTVTGSAPISPSTVKFLKAALVTGFSQGYGLTETFAGVSFSPAYEKEPGSCGAIGVSSEIRLRGLPELGYHLDGDTPAGELLVRGAQVFSHYYKNPEETAKALKDGWFYTGDVAKIDRKTGRYYIVDRVKNFFKLAHGEYVTPEKVENIYLSTNSILTQAFAHGESVQDFLVGIIGVEEEKARDFLIKRCNLPPSSLIDSAAVLEHLNHRENRVILLEELNKNLKGLFGYEKFHNIYIEYEPLRLERDVITPTIKIKRPIAAKYFDKQIKSMYAEGKLTRPKPKI